MVDQKKDFKSCPFCGAKEYGEKRERLRITSTSNGYFAVVCFCGAAGPVRNNEKRAIEAWNTRDSSDHSLPQSQECNADSTTAAGFKGNLKSLGLSSVLQVLSAESRTGVLYFTQGQEVRALCFQDGKIVAASGKEGHRLGQILSGKGLITQEQLQEALQKASEAGKRVGEVLLDLGYVSEGNLKELVRYQIREALFDISLWIEGDFEYRDCEVEFDERGISDINLMRIILETAVRKDEQAAA